MQNHIKFHCLNIIVSRELVVDRMSENLKKGTY